jgi:phosphate acyltransferase
MTTLVLDAMGGDHAPGAAVAGAARLSVQERSPDLVLVGDEGIIRATLAGVPHDGARIEIVHTPDFVPMDADPRAALDALPRASIVVATELVREGRGDALVSAGNTGGVTLACARTLPRIPGVQRCALGAVFPTEARHGTKADPFSLILDAGLTLEVGADELVSFAIMGAAYASRISRNQSPAVALLSNGSEPTKGTSAIVEAHARLRTQAGLRFIGNVEGTDIPRGTADVIVTGGFVGNVVLKMLEGIAETVTNLARYAYGQSLRNKVGLALLAPAVRQLKQLTDWEEYGGAPLLGFTRPCIKAHGRSSPRAIENALKVAHKAVRTGLCTAIAEAMTEPPR